MITKADLLSKLAVKTDMKKVDVEKFLKAFTELLKEEVIDNGNDMRLKDVGTFKQKVTPPRQGRNPRTGTDVEYIIFNHNY